MYSLTAPTVPMLARVKALQSSMLAMPDHLHIEPTHTFADGLYARSVTLPAGSVAVGHIHAQEHICIILSGRVQVVTEDGTQEFAAPQVMVVPAGRKNCVHAMEDTTWLTVHACEAKTAEDAERALIVPEANLALPYERAA